MVAPSGSSGGYVLVRVFFVNPQAAQEQCSPKSMADRGWRTFAWESNARGVSVPGRAERGKMPIMREQVDHR